MEHRNLHIVGYGLALSGALAIGASLLFSEDVVFSEVAPIGVIVLGGIFALVLGLRNVLTKTRIEYDQDHSVAYRVANRGAVIIVITAGLLLFVVGIISLGIFE